MEKKSLGKEKHLSMDYKKNRNEKGKFLPKNERSLDEKHKPKEHMATELIHFNTHRNLCQSEENGKRIHTFILF